MNWPTWIAKSETATITVWLCVITMTLNDRTQRNLLVGPRLDSQLLLEQSARSVAEQYIEACTLFLVDDQGEIIPRTEIEHIKFSDRPAQRKYARKHIFKWFKTNWKKVDTTLAPMLY